MKTGGTLYYPISLAYATGYLESRGHECRLVDCIADKMDEHDVYKIVNDFSPDLVIIDTSTPSINNDIRIADKIQSTLDGKVVLVGRHVHFDGVNTLKKCSHVKLACRGEFFSQVKELAEGQTSGIIKGMYIKRFEGVTTTGEPDLIDVNDLPMVSKVYVKHLRIDKEPHKYFYASLKNPYILLQRSFGCYANCKFCSEILKANQRTRSTELVIKEMKWIENNLPLIKEILFDDPTFNKNDKMMDEFSNAVLDNKINLSWSINARCNMSYSTIKKAVNSGCRLAHIGIESLNQKALNEIRKGIVKDAMIKFIMDAHKAGMMLHGCVIIGLYQDTNETLRDGLEALKKLPLDSVQIFPLVPTANDEIYNWAKENGHLLTTNYDEWLTRDGYYNVVISYPHLSRKQIEYWCRKYFRDYHFRRKFYFHKLRQSLMSYEEMKRNWNTYKHVKSTGRFK